jgi:hypothetical protein
MDCPINCYYLLRKKLETATGKKFPMCLEYLEETDYLHVSIDETDEFDECLKCPNSKYDVHTHCLCGVEIIYINVFINTITQDKIIIGSKCINKLIEDIKNYMVDKEEFKILYEKWLKIQSIIKNKNQKCVKCNAKNTGKRCLYKGLCKHCRYSKKKLLKTKIQLPKYKGKTIKIACRDETFIDYVNFCIKNKTRQYEIFKEYLTYLIP